MDNWFLLNVIGCPVSDCMDNRDLLKTNLNMKYFLGILNSKIISVYVSNKLLTNKNSIAQLKQSDLIQIPIPVLNLSNAAEKAKHDEMVQLVENILLKKKGISRLRAVTHCCILM